MSILQEIETITRNMSPHFIDNIRVALQGLGEEKTPDKLNALRAAVADFQSAVKILGIASVEEGVSNLQKLVGKSSNIEDILGNFKPEFEKITALFPRGDKTDKAPEKKEADPVDAAETAVDIDQSVIKDYLNISGVGEEKARILYRSGFTSSRKLAEATVADLVGVKGVNLSLAKKIVDFFNPERFLEMELAPSGKKETKETEEVSFVGVPLRSQSRDDVLLQNVEKNEDSELLEIFINRLCDYLDGTSRIIGNLSYESPTAEALNDLFDASRSLISSSRYMGFEGIEKELEKIMKATEEIIRNQESFSGSAISVLSEAQEKLSKGLEDLRGGLTRLSEVKADETLDVEYNLLNLAQHWSELSELYKETGKIIRNSIEEGEVSTENRERLKQNKSRMDAMTDSISALVEEIE